MVDPSPRGQTLPRLRRNGHAEPITTENHGISDPVPGALRTMAPAVVDRAFCDGLSEAERVVCGKPKTGMFRRYSLISKLQVDDAASLSLLTLVIILCVVIFAWGRVLTDDRTLRLA